MLRHALHMEAREGFRHNQFFLMFQPRLCATRNEVVSFEALLRWQHPRNGLLTPAHFMADLELSNVSAQLTRFLLTEAVQRIADWRTRGFGRLAMSINMPGAEIMREGFSSQVAHMLKWHDVDPQLLEIEITERTDFSVFPTLDAHVRRLQQHGVRVALDDFGTGYASLSVFQRLPFDTVKLDRSFMACAPDNNNARAVVETFIDLCQRTGRQPVIEGVEHPVQLEWLREMSGQMSAPTLAQAPDIEAQGYAVSPPVDSDEIETLLGKLNGIRT